MLKVGGFLDRLHFGRHQFTGSVDLEVEDFTLLTGSEESVTSSSSPPLVTTSEPFVGPELNEVNLNAELPTPDHHQPLPPPLTFRLQVWPRGCDQDRRQYLSVILLSEVEESLLVHRLRTQVTAVLWIESPSPPQGSGEENPAILVGRKSK